MVLKPPPHQHKPSLSSRGWQGSFLGRSRHSKGSYEVLVGNQVVRSSSVLVDEERFDWAPKAKQHQPLTAVARVPRQPIAQPLQQASPATGGNAPLSEQRLLSLFSGPYARSDGLAPRLKALGWFSVEQVDNDGEAGGGWADDLLNDANFASLLARCKRGDFHALMVAFPCSPFTIARHFDASKGGDGDRGPPVLFSREHPDGLPESAVDPRHHRELRDTKKLLERVAELVIAARLSPSRASIIFENPADRSVRGSVAFSDELSNHGAIFETSPFKRMRSEADLNNSATFAYCRLGRQHQKYTSLYYTPEAASVLDELNGPDFQCNHPRGSHSEHVGGRGSDGAFTSQRTAAYPDELLGFLARAFTFARTGSSSRATPAAAAAVAGGAPPPHSRPPPSAAHDGSWQGPPTPPLTGSSAGGVPASSYVGPSSFNGGAPPALPTASPHLGVPTSSHMGPPSSFNGGASPAPPTTSPHLGSPIAFPSLSDSAPPRRVTRARVGPSAAPPVAPPAINSPSPLKGAAYQRHEDEVLARVLANRYARGDSVPADYVPPPGVTRPAPPRAPPSPISEEPSSAELRSPGDGIAHDAYSPFKALAAGNASSDDSPAAIMEAAAAEMAFLASIDQADGELIPISGWFDTAPSDLASRGERRSRQRHLRRLPGGGRAKQILVAIDSSDLSPSAITSLGLALRADSPDAPSTHKEAVEAGPVWIKAERKELNNHDENESWINVRRDQVPRGRHVHKMIWVYKKKRDGTEKARLCVQGTTLQAGIDYDQVFSAALRYSSARALFAYAARHGCRVRSVDLVAAYLQGDFLDGEDVYCHQPVGYPVFDKDGTPMVAKVQKPIYGIQQAGRRLQRKLFDWLKSPELGFKQLDDSDPCVFTRECPDGERLVIGCYVDNLQIVHSAVLDANGRGPHGCVYNSFLDAINRDWKVVDEGPMEDLLGIEIDYLEDGSIKLHQERYVKKVVERFLPDGPSARTQRGSLPYSEDFLSRINDSLAQHEPAYPELVREFQERLGCLMYAANSTRPDIAFPVHQLCRCMQKPTPALLEECNYVLSYLARHSSVGLTYSREQARLVGFSDSSWEVAHSTSGWVVQWQSAALVWGSRKQKSIALSSCEAEIIALSEATKDVVYLRKLLEGLGDGAARPTPLHTDSQSARDVSYNPEHHDRMKHVARRFFTLSSSATRKQQPRHNNVQLGRPVARQAGTISLSLHSLSHYARCSVRSRTSLAWVVIKGARRYRAPSMFYLNGGCRRSW